MKQPWNLDILRSEFANAKPISFIKIDNFLTADAAVEIASSYPDFNKASAQGKTFSSVNERRKVQITDAARFPAPVARLNDLLASSEFLADLSYITGMPNVLADQQLLGGGIHMTGPGGRLDVHVDFNYIEDRKLHRRLNLLLYLNSPWERRWGGQFQLWDKDVRNCVETFDPIFNRCVIFETNEISFHGVIPVSPEAPFPRKSFATYYYTREAPAHWSGISHSTVFKARPDEKTKGLVLMPAEAAKLRVTSGLQKLRRGIKRIIKKRV